MEEKKGFQEPPIPAPIQSWLMKDSSPFLMYRVLSDLFRLSQDHPEIIEARKSIENNKYTSKIFSLQNDDGSWINSRHYYSPKYRSSHWTMLLLSELSINSNHDGFQKGANFMRMRVQDEICEIRTTSAMGFSCFWGNWLRYQIYGGFFPEPFVQVVINHACDEIENLGVCRYNSDLSCAWGVARCLSGLAIIPKRLRSKRVNHAIQTGIRFLIEDYNLASADYPYQEKIHNIWFSLNFPLFYHTDILFILRLLHELNAIDHPNAKPALVWLDKKRLKNGTWRGASPFRSKTRQFMANKDEPSKWVTLFASQILSST